jgi:hypothetical protein
VAARLLGGLGGITCGLAVILAAGPYPFALWARTANEYVVPFVRLSAVIVVVVVFVRGKSAGVVITWYESIGAPVVGELHDKITCRSCAVALRFLGALGGAEVAA